MPSPSPDTTTAARAEFAGQLRRFRLARQLTQEQLAGLLVVSESFVYMMERGIHPPSEQVRQRFEALQAATDIYAVSQFVGEHLLPVRQLPIISWAQAGPPRTVFDELPSDWQNTIPCRCPDQQAYVLQLAGDSMETKYHEGDLAVVMPNHQPKHGCLVVASFAGQCGYVFKKFTTCKSRPFRFKLSSYNRAYPACEYIDSDFDWVFPVYCVVSV